jgi:ubiquinol-cytochrome c reductase iron-sulfur subunit
MTMVNNKSLTHGPNTNKIAPVRRDFLYIATGTMAGMGTAIATWPFIDSMNPSGSALAEATVEVNISQMVPGQRITVIWRGKPVFIDYRTEKQIEQARLNDNTDLVDPQRDDERVQQAEWLVVIGVCTHLGCLPLGQRANELLGDWGGWFCPCHGSHYDTSGRIRKGPAPKNLVVPPYVFLDEKNIRIG